MRLIYVNSSKVTKLEQKMNNSESFLLLLKNLLKCTYEVLLPSQRNAKSINFMVKHIFPGEMLVKFLQDFSQDIMQLIMEKIKKCVLS